MIEIGGLICLALFWGWMGFGCGKGGSNAPHLPRAGTEIPPYRTTLVQTWKPLLPAVWLSYSNSPTAQADLGVLLEGEGEPHLLRDDLGVGGGGTEARASLLYFAHLSDIHLCDDESPMRMTNIDFPGPTQAAFRPQDNLSVQVLDAMIRTLNHFSDERPFDFLLNTGDSIDNDQWNEVRWLIDTFDGKVVDPDTGASQSFVINGQVVALGHTRALALVDWQIDRKTGDLCLIDLATGAQTLLAKNVYTVAVDPGTHADVPPDIDALAAGTRIAFLVRNPFASPYDGLWVAELP